MTIETKELKISNEFKKKNMLKDNLKILRKNKGLSQDDLSIKLNVVRQTISKWERGLSMPDAQMLISISKIFDVPVSDILGENIEEKKENDLKVLSEKLDNLNYQNNLNKKRKRKILINTLSIIDICLIILFILLMLLNSPYLKWDYNIKEWAILGTIYHCFEWIYFKISPILILIITIILIILIFKKNDK